MSAAALLWEPASAARAGASTDIVQTRLLPVPRAAAWQAWTSPASRAGWWGGTTELRVVEAVEPVWLVFNTTTVAPGGEPIEETASVTFVQLGEQTHVALHSVSAARDSAAGAESADATWRRRLNSLSANLRGH